MQVRSGSTLQPSIKRAGQAVHRVVKFLDHAVLSLLLHCKIRHKERESSSHSAAQQGSLSGKKLRKFKPWRENFINVATLHDMYLFH